MTFFEKLISETEAEKNYLLSAPIIKRCFEGEIALDDYVAFLGQAFHHVKHTVPLLMNLGAKLPHSQDAVAEYIEEELGHQEWILNDIAACGFDKEAVRNSMPLFETELMVSYAYDTINRIEPVAFFGMVHVLEGTSVAIADLAAATIKDKLSLPNNAFSYLRSHGSIDQEHVKFFETLMNRIDDEKQQDAIIHAAKRFYVLYGNIFRALDQARLQQVA